MPLWMPVPGVAHTIEALAFDMSLRAWSECSKDTRKATRTAKRSALGRHRLVLKPSSSMITDEALDPSAPAE